MSKGAGDKKTREAFADPNKPSVCQEKEDQGVQKDFQEAAKLRM